MGNKRGRTGNTGGGTALYVTMAAAFALIAVITAMALFFKITEIRVEGEERYTADEIIKASGIEPDTSVFFINASSAQIDIKGALPYVDTVKVTRKLPGTIVISVTESKAVAYIASGGKYYLMDAGGRILEETASVPSKTELRGVKAVEPTVGKTLSLGESESVRCGAALELLKFMDGQDKLGLTGWIDFSNMSAVIVEYNGYRINIGTCDELDSKFKLINDFLSKNTEPGNGKSVFYDDKKKGLWF